MKVAVAASLALLLLGCGGSPQLVEAAADGRTADVKKLLAEGASIDGAALDDWTPLTVAASVARMK